MTEHGEQRKAQADAEAVDASSVSSPGSAAPNGAAVRCVLSAALPTR